MLRAENRRQDYAVAPRRLVRRVREPVIDGRRVADDPDSPALERTSGQQPLGSKLYAHAAIISQGF